MEKLDAWHAYYKPAELKELREANHRKVNDKELVRKIKGRARARWLRNHKKPRPPT
jgi:mRNA-degrading endonuclease HigB of HigAB toxin-antitoxin module